MDKLKWQSEGEVFKVYPKLETFWKSVHEQIKDFYDSDRCLKAPFNGATAKINN